MYVYGNDAHEYLQQQNTPQATQKSAVGHTMRTTELRQKDIQCSLTNRRKMCQQNDPMLITRLYNCLNTGIYWYIAAFVVLVTG